MLPNPCDIVEHGCYDEVYIYLASVIFHHSLF